MAEFSRSDLNQIARKPKRGHYDKDTIYAILDEALVCHVGFVQGGQPVVIPTIHARDHDTLIFHGAKASRLLKHIQDGHPICVAVTLLDGIVFARSAFNHSMNYRSVVLFGRGRTLASDEEKLRASEVLTEHIARGRWKDIRKPNRQELDATAFAGLAIESASAKIRTGPPGDDEEDYQLPIWAGVLPVPQQTLAPIADPRLASDISVPDYLLRYARPR